MPTQCPKCGAKPMLCHTCEIIKRNTLGGKVTGKSKRRGNRKYYQKLARLSAIAKAKKKREAL